MSCGIYVIINKETLYTYHGSSFNIEKRISTHKNDLNKNKHHSEKLQKDWIKYGSEAFEFHIVVECEREHLRHIEQSFLWLCEPEYNVAINATAPMEGKKHKPETLLKFKNRTPLSGPENYMYGTKWSEEKREKILKTRKENGYTHPENTKIKMSETAKKIGQGWQLKSGENKLAVKDSLGNSFTSLGKAAEFHKMSIQGVCDILKGRTKKTRKGVIFFYE